MGFRLISISLAFSALAPASVWGHATTTCSALPANPSLPTVSKLPDPSLPVSGPRVSTKSGWQCCQQEISVLLQRYELGTLPPKPPSVTASFSGNKLTINCADSGNYPSCGTTPYPALIAYGGLSVPPPAGVAVIILNNNDIAGQNSASSRGRGKFFTLYGSGHSAGAMAAWAWEFARINTKISMVAGAFDPRIVLTIPQASGSGGAACWRLPNYQQSIGQNVQTASEIVSENVWFSTNSVNTLPFDHHTLAGLISPRGLFVIENTYMEWLGNLSTYGCMKTAHKLWEALGVPDSMGFSQVGNHNHCQFPSFQQGDLNAFVNNFLLGKSTNTNITKTDRTFTFNEGQ
ncbi:Glucuronoyl esterase catalytic domain from Hypocrea Jecorina [Sphaerosporella brunnea]|uniref:(4-O-methyl)-D-glucuronate--lignin esterase n=1 Tax=Sphaerosporella brunnea TaxID=1250544 RepID=A0A5J5EXC3_9PEZI|nr:Glucuronoyl esterase catalytic domain from Hypocrea Jecorina [Sphaerosporella brunnea]